MNIYTTNCPKCNSKKVKSSNSLHAWEIQYECGATVMGAIDKEGFDFHKVCGDKPDLDVKELVEKLIPKDKNKEALLESLNKTICKLTAIELSDLIKYLNKKFGVE